MVSFASAATWLVGMIAIHARNIVLITRALSRLKALIIPPRTLAPSHPVHARGYFAGLGHSANRLSLVALMKSRTRAVGR